MSSPLSVETLLVLIPALPLASALVTAALGKWFLGGRSHWPTVAALAASFVLSLLLVGQIARGLPPAHRAAEQRAAEEAAQARAAADDPAGPVSAALAAPQPTGYERTTTLWTWAGIAAASATRPVAASPSPADAPRPAGWNFSIDVTLRADPLTAVMLSMVLLVATLVAVYAGGYMHGDRGYWRFFSYVSLFVFSMTMLVEVSNFALLYVFWEAVGVSSYLLIGFWFEKPEAAAAGKKAFLVNRVGDFGFALGVFLIWTTYGTLNFHDADGVAGVLGQTRLASGQFVGGATGLAICLLLFVGACGKSAQFPLHVWLPDAMEGPTPVSALIHAATMVTAGVYLVARTTPLFAPLPDVTGAWLEQSLAHEVVAVVGITTALLGALTALTQTDLKRILAYSTISQLGFMFLGLGAGTRGGVTAGMFHLFTHAFFKALLFLGAGSVMHAMGGVIDVRRFGGLRRLLPTTHWTFLFGALALAGIVPFAGFWSKDQIMGAIHARAHHGERLYEVLFYLALTTASLTAFYTFRAFFLTFYGKLVVPREAGHQAHESPRSMTLPLAILALCSLVVGAWFEWTHGLVEFLAQTPSLAYRPLGPLVHEFHADVATMSTLVALLGVGLAAFLYLGQRREVEWLTRLMKRLYLYPLSLGKFFFDPIYAALIVWPALALAAASAWIDRVVVDGLVNLVGRIAPALGSAVRVLEMGVVQFYGLAMMLGLLVLLFAMLLG